MAAIGFRTARGQTFDGFALDIEPSATTPKGDAPRRQPPSAESAHPRVGRTGLPAGGDDPVTARDADRHPVLAGLPVPDGRPVLRRRAADELLDVPGQRRLGDVRLHGDQHRPPARRAGRPADPPDRRRGRRPVSPRDGRLRRGSQRRRRGRRRAVALRPDRTTRTGPRSGCSSADTSQEEDISASLPTVRQLRIVPAPPSFFSDITRASLLACEPSGSQR